MLIFFILLSLVLSAAVTTVGVKLALHKQVPAPKKNLLLESHELVGVRLTRQNLNRGSYRMVDVPSWEFTCSCGTKEIDTSRSSTEKNAIGMFRAHREIWSDFAQTERQQINAGISRNADQLKELNSLSSGLLSLNQSVSKLGRMKK